MRQRPLALQAEGWLCVHAGVPPQWDADQTLRHAAEVQALLQGPDLSDFLPLMYGNEPARWDDGLSGAERLRCIVNALTRLRFCTADGQMEFQTKEGPGAPPEGYMPWFEVPGRRTANDTVVFGHWSTLGLVQQDKLLGLDTGCVWGGKLSALKLTADPLQRQLLQVDWLLPGLVVALLSSATPYALEMYALKHLPKRSFSILLSLEPAVGAVAGWIMLAEALSLQQWLAIALVMTASMGSAWSVRAAAGPQSGSPAPP